MSMPHFFQTFALLSARVLGLLAAAMTLVWTCNTNTDQKYLGGLNTANLIFNWHPFLMVLGMCCFLTNGITAFRITATSHLQAKRMHVAWYVLSASSVVLGLIAVFKSHERSTTANLYSLHSWIGIGAITVFCLNFLFGMLHFLNPLCESVALKDQYKPYHIFGGVLAFLLFFMAIETGLQEKNTFLGGCICTIRNSLIVHSHALNQE
jgi:cytochrome b-561